MEGFSMVLLTALGVGGATAVGALLGFAFKDITHKFSDIVLSFAAGVMLSAAVLIVTAAVLKQRTDALALVSMLYYANLILNVVFAFADFRKHALLSIGLLLFLFCDTVIGLSMLDGYLAIPQDALIYRFIHPGFDLAWACYLPSQVLITLSLLDKRKSIE